MAQTQVHEIQNSPPATPAKRRGPKPKAPLEAETPEQGGIPGYFEATREIPPGDWTEMYFQYLYRTGPITDRTATGQHKYIEKFVKFVDQEEVMKLHGSGGYKLVLNRFHPEMPQGQNYKIVRTGYFQIQNMNHPPKVPLGDWVDDPKNKDWQWAKPYLETEQATRTSNAQTPQMTGAPASDLVNMFNAGVNTAKAAIPPPAAAVEPKSDLPMLLAIVEKIVPRRGEGEDPMVKILMQQNQQAHDLLKEERQRNHELTMKTLNAPPPAAAANPLKDALEVITTMKQAAGMFRNSPAGKEEHPGWDILKAATTQIIGIVPTVMQNIQKGAGQRPAGRPATPGVIDTTATPIEGAQPQHEPTEEERMQFTNLISQQYGPMLDEIAPFLVDQFKRDMSGMDFRDWFTGEYGMRGWNAMRQMDPRTIVAVLELRKAQAEPHVQKVLAELQPPERVLEFVTEFLSETPADEPDDDTDDSKATKAGAPTIIAPDDNIDPHAPKVF